MALEVVVELSSIIRVAGWGSAEGNPGDMGSISKSGNGSSGKSHKPSGCRSSALGKSSRVGGVTIGSASSCIRPTWMYVHTTVMVMATIVLVFSHAPVRTQVDP